MEMGGKKESIKITGFLLWNWVASGGVVDMKNSQKHLGVR